MSEATPPLGLNHVAYLTHDTAQTVGFYTSLLGMKLVGHALEDKVESTGEAQRFLHTFFAMEDGSCVAFFELENLPAGPDRTVIPRWVRHLALSVQTRTALDAAHERLVAAGVEVLGPVDHEGIWQSIYFFDPNDIRLELTYQRRPLGPDDAEAAEAAVAEWVATHPPHSDIPA